MKIEKFCLQCGETLPDYAPTNKQYCSDACKQVAYRERQDDHDDKDQVVAPESESGLHPLAWLGMIGAAAWLLSSTNQTRNKPVTTQAIPSTLPSLDNL